MNAIITGANAGIGKEAAVQLAKAGYEVILACRNADRARVAREEIVERSGGAAEIMLCDVSSQKSVRAFCETFSRRATGLDVLINNAAHFDPGARERLITDEGQESVWATNHLGPFLMTHLLGPQLEKAGGRVINVSSKGLVTYPFLELNLEDPTLSGRPFSMQRAYYHSKLAVVISTVDLARRWAARGIALNTVRVTNVKVDASRYPGMSPLQRKLYSLKSRYSIEPSVMAETYTWLATSPEVKAWSGKHVDERHRVLRYRPYVLRPEVQEKLYRLSARSVGLEG